MQLATKLVQIGVGRDKATGAVSVPIYQSATFRHPSLGQSTGFDYSRTGNPTRQALEEGIAVLEGGCRGRQGEHPGDIFGNTYQSLDEDQRYQGDCGTGP